MLAARGGLQNFFQRGIFQPEIQEAGAGDFYFFAEVGNIQFGERVAGKLARIGFANIGERYQGVGLVVAKFRIARPD